MSQASIPFGKYRLIASLGRGGTAEVFLALSRGAHGFEKLVVLKRLRAEVADEESFKAILSREARLAARLSHPNIVQTYEVGEHEGQGFLAMEYLDGQPLNRVIAPSRRGAPRLPATFTARVVADALAGLHYAHTLTDFDGGPLNIVHRDVSPHNVFVTYQGEVKLVDFGIAKTSLDEHATEVGVLKGKLAYMAPEQALGERVDGRADVFSIGCVMFEMLAGRRLFDAEAAADVLRQLLSGQMSRLSDVVSCDPVLDAICMRALARVPADRYPNADAMREELEAWLRRVGGGRRDDVRRQMDVMFARQREQTRRRVGALVGAVREEVAADATGELPVVGATSGASSSPSDATPTTAMPDTEMGAAITSDDRRRALRGRASLLATVGLLLLAGAVISARVLRGPEVISAKAPPSAPITIERVALRLCGSNTIGETLAPALIESFLRKRHLGSSRTHGSNAHETIIVDATGDRWIVEAEGSATAFSGLASGGCDIGMASRPIRDDELKATTQLGDLRLAASEHVIGLDGIAVVVHPNFPRRSLTIDEIANVFAGEVSEWSPGAPIAVHARDDKSGTYDTFAHLVLGKRRLVATARRWIESDKLSAAVASDANAIGFIGLAFIGGAKPLAVGDKGATPSLPSVFTVTTEAYPLSRRLYFYLPARPRRSLALELTTFVLSNEGQQVVRDAGFVDLAIGERDVDACIGCPPRYALATKGARRLSFDFHFRAGTDQLDSRGTRDLDRLVTFLHTHPGTRLRLLGFGESSMVSLARAQIVADELAARGVKAERVLGLGTDMPIASSDTPEGRARNQRVEVWID